MRRFILDPNNPPKMSKEARARLDAMTYEEITARTGLSQRQFAEVYRINVARLRDLEQGRTQPDSAMLAYLAVIAREPEAVERALREDEKASV